MPTFSLCLPANERKNLHLAGKQPDSVVSYPYYNAPAGLSNNSGLLTTKPIPFLYKYPPGSAGLAGAGGILKECESDSYLLITLERQSIYLHH